MENKRHNYKGKNPTDVNFANISNQIQFIDTIKYFQQSLAELANSMRNSGKSEIYSACKKYILIDPKLSKKFSFLSKTDKEWVLEYLSSGKGTIPYELISDFDSLNISPNKDFFEMHEFYSNMKNSVLSAEDYENVKNFYKLMNLSKLCKLNQIYNFQDTILLCEIFEQRSEMLKNIFKFNPRKCNSASSFSGYVHRNKNKCCIAFPTDAGHVRAFEKTLIGGFSCVNTRLAFDINILLNNPGKEKVLVESDINEKKQTKCISSKILKMDENNQYRMA